VVDTVDDEVVDDVDVQVCNTPKWQKNAECDDTYPGRHCVVQVLPDSI